MDEKKEAKKPLPVRNLVAGVFGLMLCFGALNKMSGTAKPGGYTQLFDTALIVIGAVGGFAALLWPKQKPPLRPR